MNDEVQYGIQVHISPLTSNDVGHTYLSWMNDIDLTQYMESRFTKYNLKDLSKEKEPYLLHHLGFQIFLNKVLMHIIHIWFYQ